MIQVIKEHLVKDVIGWTRQASYTTKDAFIDRIKAIPSAEPYKGMTNGEVIQAVFPHLMIFEKTASKVVWGRSESETQWWNRLYEPQESEKI